MPSASERLRPSLSTGASSLDPTGLEDFRSQDPLFYGVQKILKLYYELYYYYSGAIDKPHRRIMSAISVSIRFASV